MKTERLNRMNLLQMLDKIDTKIQVTLEKALLVGSWHDYLDEYLALHEQSYAVKKRLCLTT